MGSLKFYFAPVFKVNRQGHVTVLAKPPMARELSKEDWEISIQLAKAGQWLGFDLPPHKQTYEEDLVDLATGGTFEVSDLFDEEEIEDVDY